MKPLASFLLLTAHLPPQSHHLLLWVRAFQVMGGLSNMALWLQIPLTSPAGPVPSADLTAAGNGKEPLPSSSKPALANGHQPLQGSATHSLTGKLHMCRFQRVRLNS